MSRCVKKTEKLSDKVYSSQTMNCLKHGFTTTAPPASQRKPFGEARSWKYFQKNCWINNGTNCLQMRQTVDFQRGHPAKSLPNKNTTPLCFWQQLAKILWANPPTVTVFFFLILMHVSKIQKKALNYDCCHWGGGLRCSVLGGKHGRSIYTATALQEGWPAAPFCQNLQRALKHNEGFYSWS